MGFTEKTNYLKDSKEILRNALQDLGADIDAETPFRQYMKDNIIDTIWNNAKKVSAEGSNIMLQGAAAGKIEITPKGNTEQETTNGYNMLPYKNTTQTKNGLTFTNNGDGTLLINGTATKQTIYCINAESIAGIILDMKLESTSYRVSVGQPMSNSTFLVQLAYRKPDETIGYASVATDGGTINNLTIQDINNNAGFGLIIREGTSFDNMLIKPMLQLATTSYDFEPYTGGIASPNPDYPQDIKVVTGENTIKIGGSNLVDENNLTALTNINNITNKIVTSNSLTNTGSAGCNVGFPELNIETGDYYISADIRLKSGTVNSLSSIQMWARSSWTVSARWVNNPSLSNEFQRYVRKYTVNNIGDISNTIYSFYTQLSNPDNAVLEIKNIQISRTNVNYEPYIEPIEKELNLGNIELVKIGNNSDLIFKNEKSNPYYDDTLIENDWYKKEIIGKAILTGAASESWGTSNNIRYTSAITDYSLHNNKPYSNYFIGETNKTNTGDTFLENSISFNNYDAYNRMYVKASSIEDIRVWLQAHNLTVYYIKRTFTDIQITDTTLINQLEEINSIIGNGGTVVIETESEEENAQLIVNASALEKEV